MPVTSPIRVLAAVVERDGRFLICRRPSHKRHGGLWEFPGGKIEAGESDFRAAQRELAEELELRTIRVGATRFAIDDLGSPFRIEFIDVSIEGTPRCIEHTELAWVAPDALLEFPLAPSDRRFVEHLLAMTSDARSNA
jgi:8-oxo-dGTP pyrophosphatase MutT (NUDIX family)